MLQVFIQAQISVIFVLSIQIDLVFTIFQKLFYIGHVLIQYSFRKSVF